MAARTPRHHRRRRPPRRCSRHPGRAARAVPGADQPHRSRRQYLRLVLRPRRGRQLGTDRPRRHPPPGPGRLRPSPHPLVRHPPRARRHRGRARLRPRPPPLDPAAAQRSTKPGRTRPTAGRRARRLPARPEHHLHPDRQGDLRPCQPGRPLHPQPETQAPGPGPHRDLPGAGLRRPRRDTATWTTPSPTPPGITCQCDLAPPCRRHHRVKQAPGWKLEQPEPGVMRWTTPSGRSYTTTPTVYEM